MYVEQKSIGECIISIQGIIIISRSGIPLFQDRFDDYNVDPTLVAGISTALTTYADELMTHQQMGVETLKKSNISITSSKTESSTIVVVSLTELVPELIQQIRVSQKSLEDYYDDKFQGRDSSRDLMDPTTVYRIFDNSGFNIGLKKFLQIQESNIIAIKEDRTIGPTVRFHLGSLKELIGSAQIAPSGIKVINLSSVLAHLKARNLDDKMIGNLIVQAYENKILTFTIF
ncbi:MAG: hypothetical protein ACW99A_06070 [Candidatus Kariarchaeaceae archaeon]|jgi:hypothetical protein